MGDSLVVNTMVNQITEMIPPLIFMVGGITAGIVAMVFRAKSKERAHRERMAYIEKGMEIPAELNESYQSGPRDYRVIRMLLLITGTLCICIGFGAGIAVTIEKGIETGMGGFIGILVGVGCIISERLILKRIIKNGYGG